MDGRRRSAWELIDGHPVMRVGVTRAHSMITLNIAAAALHPVARRRGCETHATDFFTSGGPVSGFLAARDVFVRCGPLDDHARLAEDPLIVVEVLSPSTIRHDRVRKFERYTAIPSLRQIVLVYQDEIRVESFVHSGADWSMVVFKALDASLPCQLWTKACRCTSSTTGGHLDDTGAGCPGRTFGAWLSAHRTAHRGASLRGADSEASRRCLRGLVLPA